MFRLYCESGLSAQEVASQCNTTKTTVVRRLTLLRSRLGVDPRQLRRFSPHLAQLADSLHDPRAEKIYPAAVLDQTESDEEF